MKDETTFYIVIFIVLVWLYTIGASRDNIYTVPTDPPPDTSRVAGWEWDDASLWSYDLLTRLENKDPDMETIMFVNAWQKGENTDAAFNPLATTQDMPDATCFNSVCVKNYISRDQGLDATVITITNGRYPHILEGLQTNQPDLALNDEELGVWGSGKANVESNWTRTASVATPRNVSSARQQVIQIALSQVGKPYILGTEGPDSFDCSGLVQWVYSQIDIDTTRTTFTQLDALKKIDASQIQTGDMVYFEYPWDQHVGILFPGEDGKWAMVHAAAPGLGVIVTEDVFEDTFYTDNIIGYRSTL